MAAHKVELYRPRGAFDLLRLPVIGRVLKHRYGRLVLQLPFLLIAALLIYDGFTGPQRPAENLATVVPWVHYRGFVVLALLLVGNLFCMGCPFTLPRTLAKRLSLNPRRFPRALRGKWLAVAGLFGIFFLYEWLDMWASPALTAWVIVAYFIASFALEALFGESAFCKYVCPLGTFNFVYSTTAPTQITSKNLDICRTCVGKECVNGSYSLTPVIRVNEIKGGDATITHDKTGTPGCPTELFVPQIKTNLDCLLCLDCVRACPHDNVALMVRTPGRELMQPEAWAKRWDIAFLVIALAFMGVINAFGMIPPVYDLMQDAARALDLTALGLSDFVIEGIVLGLIFIGGGLLLPAVLMTLAGKLGQALTRTAQKYDLRHTVSAFAPAFVPIGLGIWFGHYGFHFLIGALSIVPVFQTFLIDHRIYLLGTEPDWALASIVLDTGMIGLIQVGALVGGFLWSMVIANRVSLRLYRRDAPMGLFPWALVLLGLMLATIAIFSQPMEMRGTILFS
jgi:polyferredoxin